MSIRSRGFSLFLASLSLALVGCAPGNIHMPVLPGPADSVHCLVARQDSLEGTYECTVKGRYVMEKPGIF